MENKDEKVFSNYPITIKSKELKNANYEITKKLTNHKDITVQEEGVLDKVKEKALEVKDSVVDTTEDALKDNKQGK